LEYLRDESQDLPLAPRQSERTSLFEEQDTRPNAPDEQRLDVREVGDVESVAREQAASRAAHSPRVRVSHSKSRRGTRPLLRFSGVALELFGDKLARRDFATRRRGPGQPSRLNGVQLTCQPS
jgi:hypothetical protein